MELWIEHVVEPDRLILSWEAPAAYPDRKRWAIGEIESREKVTFRYYQADEFAVINANRDKESLRSAGYRGFPAFLPSDRFEPFADRVLEAFGRRLPPLDRPDFELYLKHHRLRSDLPISTLSLLAATGARLPSDGFELVDPLAYADKPIDVVIQIAGYRYNLENSPPLTGGDSLDLIAEPYCEYDSDAVAVTANGLKVGYVNRLQAAGVKRMIAKADVSAYLLRLNGTPDRPKAYAFLRVRPKSRRQAA